MKTEISSLNVQASSIFGSTYAAAVGWRRAIAVAVAVAFSASHLHANVLVASHTGADDPVDKGWNLVNYPLWAGNEVSSVAEEGAWQTKDTSTNKNRPAVLYTYNTEEHASAARNGWRLSATVSLIEASKEGVAILAFTGDNGRRYILTFDANKDNGNTRVMAWYGINEGGQFSSDVVDTGTKGYITVHMVHDGFSASVYLGDSADPVITGYTGLDKQNSWKNTVRWGTSNGLETATLNWRKVEFSVVP